MVATPTVNGLAAGAAAWDFSVLRGAQAVVSSASCAGNAFQNPHWVLAVAAARGRPHEFVAVQATRRSGATAYLLGALHRRAGLSVFEAMPMGGYGGWLCDSGLSESEEASLTAQWLRRSPWPIVRLTSEPGRPHALPPALRWPLPAALGRRLEAREFDTHLLDLTGDEASRLKRVKPNVRSYLRRVDDLGFSFTIGGPDAASAFCDWYRRGSNGWAAAAGALLPDAFFHTLVSGGLADVWQARCDGEAVAAGLFLRGRTQVQYQASGSAKKAGPVSAMDALLWAAARHYASLGFETLNMGASEGLDSVRRFKEKFGAVAACYRCVTYGLPGLGFRLGLAGRTAVST